MPLPLPSHNSRPQPSRATTPTACQDPQAPNTWGFAVRALLTNLYLHVTYSTLSLPIRVLPCPAAIRPEEIAGQWPQPTKSQRCLSSSSVNLLWWHFPFNKEECTFNKQPLSKDSQLCHWDLPVSWIRRKHSDLLSPTSTTLCIYLQWPRQWNPSRLSLLP